MTDQPENQRPSEAEANVRLDQGDSGTRPDDQPEEQRSQESR